MTPLRDIARGVLRVTSVALLLFVLLSALPSCNLGGESCQGEPDGCHSQLCANVEPYGCQVGPGCFGVVYEGEPDSCSGYSESDCAKLPKCGWDSSPTACTGNSVQVSCLGQDSESECRKIGGCTWASG